MGTTEVCYVILWDSREFKLSETVSLALTRYR